MNNLWQDLRYGARILLKNPGFTAIAVLTLALGMGANTAIFSVVNAVLLRSLPYQKANELVDIFLTNSKHEDQWALSPVVYLNLKENNTVFTEMAAISNKGWAANLTGQGEPERLQGFQISADLFRLLGVAPLQGRSFSATEDSPGNNRVVILSHKIWQRRFGGDADLIGHSINLNGAAYTVVGVMPADFRLFDADVWTPLAFTTADERDESFYLMVFGRLNRGVSTKQALAEVDSIHRSWIDNPNSDSHAGLRPLQESITQQVDRMLWILFAVVGFVLLIACANVANLLLARGSVRRRELAIRMALGAGRYRIVRQLLVESAMLAALGGGCGLLLALWCVPFLSGGLLPEYLTQANSHIAMLSIDGRALGFMLALMVLTTLIFGLLPALQSSKVNLSEPMRESGSSETQGRARSRLRSLLVVTEIALSMVLLVGAGLMLKSFWRLSKVELGFNPAGVLSAKIDPTYQDFQHVVSLHRRLLERISSLPDVQYAGIVNTLASTSFFTIEEHPPLPEDKLLQASNNQVNGDYFRAMGIPLRAGRFFNDGDIRGMNPVAIIDETLASQNFQNENPLGKHVYYQGASREIVGVVGATKFGNLREKAFPQIYLPYQQENWHSMTLRIRARTGDPMKLIPAIRSELAVIDKDLPLYSFELLEESVSQWNSLPRFSASLLSAFAALALLLAAIGIYGVLGYTVAQRTQEIGIRMALGADRADVFKLIIGEGMRDVGLGLWLGLYSAYVLTSWMEAELFEVRSYDPSTYVVIAVLLAGVALFACYLPARRATKTDPMIALRCD
jgi:putative ABC transport system permease protein